VEVLALDVAGPLPLRFGYLIEKTP
jgi:hypothetical protein